MKKNILIYILSFTFIILLFINKNLLGPTIINTSIIFIKNFMPYFISLFIISKILINYNFPYYISKLFNNNIYVYIITLSILGGTPNNMIIIKDLLNNNMISINEANKYIKCSFFTNPLFLYSMLIKVFSIKTTIIIILSHYLANIIIYLIKPIKNNSISKINTISFNKCFINSIKELSILIINIYITIIIFNIIISLLPNILNNYKGLIQILFPARMLRDKGLIELTYGLNYIVNANIYYKDILALIYISFGGISIITQIKEILYTNINFNNFVISRFYQIIISIIIYILLQYLSMVIQVLYY